MDTDGGVDVDDMPLVDAKLYQEPAPKPRRGCLRTCLVYLAGLTVAFFAMVILLMVIAGGQGGRQTPAARSTPEDVNAETAVALANVQMTSSPRSSRTPTATREPGATMMSVYDRRETRTAEAGGAAASPTASATRPSATPWVVTLRATMTPRMTATPSLDAQYVDMVAALPGVVEVQGAGVAFGEFPFVELIVAAGNNTQAFAESVRLATTVFLGFEADEFSAILYDGVSAPISYLWRVRTGDWTQTELPSIATRMPRITTVAATRTPVPLPTSAAACNGVDDLNCTDFASDAQAQAHLLMCGNEDRIDGDEDGRACEFE